MGIEAEVIVGMAECFRTGAASAAKQHWLQGQAEGVTGEKKDFLQALRRWEIYQGSYPLC